MPTRSHQWWLHFSERAFFFNFIAFSFAMFSCLPTGFSATFSTFAFVFAVPLFLSHIDWANISLFEKVGLLLFGWLFLSIFWSEVGFVDGLSYLSEYRLYFMIPFFSTALLYVPNAQKWALYAAVAGAVIALIISYGSSFDWWTIQEGKRSLANRIYHGFIMSLLFLVALLVARHDKGIIRIIAMVVALLAAYNVLNIEVGRTGYLQIITVSFLFVVLSFARLKATIIVLLLFVALGFSYLVFYQLSARVNQTLTNIERMVADDDYKTSAGYRLEFYRAAVQVGVENPLGGVGVGDVVAELESLAKSGEIRVETDNVHSEFMNMLMAGGVPALLLFLLFVSSIARVGFGHRKTDKAVGDALIGISAIVFVSALFNSTIKDYGEKHVLLIILSILASKLCAGLKISESQLGSVRSKT